MFFLNEMMKIKNVKHISDDQLKEISEISIKDII